MYTPKWTEFFNGSKKVFQQRFPFMVSEAKVWNSKLVLGKGKENVGEERKETRDIRKLHLETKQQLSIEPWTNLAHKFSTVNLPRKSQRLHVASQFDIVACHYISEVKCTQTLKFRHTFELVYYKTCF